MVFANTLPHKDWENAGLNKAAFFRRPVIEKMEYEPQKCFDKRNFFL